MPSPFPGMDPYLEDPGLWPDVHHGLISQMQAELNQRVGDNYYVRVEERVYVTDLEDAERSLMIPDLRIGQTPKVGHMTSPPQTTITIDVAEPELITTLLDDEIHEAHLEVVDRVDRSVVTIIEVLSPSNKVPGSKGRASYQQKRREVMDSPCTWIEIDLLRAGDPIIPRQKLGGCDYYVHISQVEQRPKGAVWRIRLPQRLPGILIPLKSEDSAVPLDLQQVLDTAYNRGAYNKTIDYQSPPATPLPPELEGWAEQLLKAKGLRE